MSHALTKSPRRSRAGGSLERCLASLGLTFALLAAVTTARADQATAQALFEAGARARDAGDFAAACEKFEASNQLDPAPGTALNIADCREQLGQLTSAWQRYTEAADRLPPSDPRSKYAASKAEALKGRLPTVTLSWKDPQVRGDIYLNGSLLPASAIGVPLPVDPGPHTYTVRAKDTQDAVFTVELHEGENQPLVLTLGTKLAPAAPVVVASVATVATPPKSEPAADTENKTSTLRTVGWVGIGLGGAGLVLGTVTGLLAMDRAQTVEDDCADDFCRTEEGKKSADQGRTLAPLSTVSFIVGGVFAATGLTLVLLHSGDKKSSSLAASPRPHVRLTLHAGLSQNRFSFEGAF